MKQVRKFIAFGALHFFLPKAQSLVSLERRRPVQHWLRDFPWRVCKNIQACAETMELLEVTPCPIG
jgi:hypothetical protein